MEYHVVKILYPCDCKNLQEAVGERYILVTCQPGAIEDVVMYDA